MTADIGKIIGTAFRYALSFSRILPYFLINLLILAGIVALFTSAVNLVSAMQAGQKMMYFGSFLASLIVFIIVIIAISLVKLFIDAAITDNSRQFWAGKDRFLSSSYPAAKKKYLSALGAVIIVGMITTLLSLIPFVGWLISIIVGITLAFVIQAAVISNKKATQALAESYGIFRKNKLTTVLFWILTVIILLVFLFLALVPVAIAALPVFMGFVGSGGNLSSIIPLIQQNMTGLVAGGVVGCLIFAYAEVFYQAALSFYYLSAKGRRS